MQWVQDLGLQWPEQDGPSWVFWVGYSLGANDWALTLEPGLPSTPAPHIPRTTSLGRDLSEDDGGPTEQSAGQGLRFTHHSFYKHFLGWAPKTPIRALPYRNPQRGHTGPSADNLMLWEDRERILAAMGSSGLGNQGGSLEEVARPKP